MSPTLIEEGRLVSEWVNHQITFPVQCVMAVNYVIVISVRRFYQNGKPILRHKCRRQYILLEFPINKNSSVDAIVLSKTFWCGKCYRTEIICIRLCRNNDNSHSQNFFLVDVIYYTKLISTDTEQAACPIKDVMFQHNTKKDVVHFSIHCGEHAVYGCTKCSWNTTGPYEKMFKQ